MLRSFADARLLVIDDVPTNVDLLCRLLAREGIEQVIGVTDSRDAVSTVEEVNPDLVLLDLRMPHVDGYQILEELKRRQISSAVPVLVLTAEHTREAAHRALDLGARDFLTKPFDATETLLRVRNLLEVRYLHRALLQHNVDLREQLERSETRERAVHAEQSLKRQRIENLLVDGGPAMVFQPIIEIEDSTVVGYEALSRFEVAPERGPQVWFAEAGEVGLGPELEVAAMRSALAALEELPEHAYLAVNVSPHTLLSGRLEAACKGQPCDRLVLELTEHVPVEDYGLVRDAIEPLRRRGVRLAVDDTGAGFASFRHILGLRPEIIKLDISLVHGLSDDPSRRALAAAIVTFAAEVGARLVAEGVETADELAVLRRIGVHWAQGYHIGRPAPMPLAP